MRSARIDASCSCGSGVSMSRRDLSGGFEMRTSLTFGYFFIVVISYFAS